MTLAASTLLLALSAITAGDELRVIGAAGDDAAPSQMMATWLAERARSAVDRRTEAYEQLASPEDCEAWQRQRREFFLEQLGGFPEPTPLNARVVGEIAGDGYRIEKVIYESRPQHHVTASLYLPEAEPPYPAVLVACGHSRTAKAADYNQRICILLARYGMAAFCYDPIGQGERSQILTDEGQPRHGGTTTEHSLIGVGSILVGTNTAAYRIYDGMRGIDYLTSRGDVDASKIGCTGCSGGGTLTSYIMALDDRVACAAPACYITTFGRLIDTIGPQDAEQNIHGQVAFGLDQPDYLLMRAPRPTLICATTDDFFDIEGTWDALRQAKRFYGRLGHPERVDLVEVDSGHGIPPQGRESMTAWMRRWLMGIDDRVEEPDVPLHSEEELRCTPDGQVLLLEGEKSVFDLNVDRERRLADERRSFWKQTSKDDLRQAVRDTAGIRTIDELPEPQRRDAGSVDRDGYRIDKLVLTPEPGIELPALVAVPASPSGDAYLYLHGEGKHIDAEPGGPIEALVTDGHFVMAVDLRGIGETASGADGGALAADWKNYFLAYLLGKSYVGMRAEDALLCARFLAEYETEGDPHRVHLIGIGEAGVPALHAAAVQPERFVSLRLQSTLESWTGVVGASEAPGQLIHAVHGALERYDLPDLVGLYGAEQTEVREPVQLGRHPD